MPRSISSSIFWVSASSFMSPMLPPMRASRLAAPRSSSPWASSTSGAGAAPALRAVPGLALASSLRKQSRHAHLKRYVSTYARRRPEEGLVPHQLARRRGRSSGALP